MLAESSENTSTYIVGVSVAHFPGVVGGDVPCQAECQKEGGCPHVGFVELDEDLTVQ